MWYLTNDFIDFDEIWMAMRSVEIGDQKIENLKNLKIPDCWLQPS